MRSVALNDGPQHTQLLDMDGLDGQAGGGAPGSAGQVALVRRTPSTGRYDETPGEPVRPSRGVSRAAGLKPQGAADQQVLNGECTSLVEQAPALECLL